MSPKSPCLPLPSLNRDAPCKPSADSAGKLFLIGMSGVDGNPIEISAYGEGEKPYINAAGYLAGVHIRNAHFVDIRDLRISADGGATVDSSPANERYGVLVDATTTNTIGNVNVIDLEIHDVYPEIAQSHEGRNPLDLG